MARFFSSFEDFGRCVVVLVERKYRRSRLYCTIDCDPERECTWFGTCMAMFEPIVPIWPGPVMPFWCGKVWKFIALVGSISSRNPSRWNVAYGQISSSMPMVEGF